MAEEKVVKEEAESPAPAESAQATGWILWLVATSLVVLAYIGSNSDNQTYDIAYLVGYYLPSSLIIFGVFYLLFLRKQARKAAAVSFVVIYVAAMLGGVIAASRQREAAAQALGRIEDQYSTIMESPGRLSKPENTGRSNNAGQMPHSAVGEFERFMKEFMNQLVAQRNDYTLELSAIGWDSILDPSRLEKDKTFAESQLVLAKGKDIVRKYRERTSSLLQSTRARINNLQISSSLKQDMIQGFDRGMKNTQGQIDRLWELEEMTILEVEKIINLLSRRSGSWVVFGKRIVFENNNDLQRFNMYMANIRRHVAEQEEIQKRSTDSVENFFKTAKEALR